MEQNDLKELWDGVRRLVGQFQRGRYWTDRRDACEELHKVGRQAIFRLRQAAEDADPDVAHWGRQACQEIAQSLTIPNQEAARKADAELAEGGIELAALPSEVHAAAPPSTPPAAVLDSPEKLLAWLERFAAKEEGTFKKKEPGGLIVFPLAGGRNQTIYIDLAHKEHEGEPLALFYSVCGEAKPETFEWALQANCNLSAGAFGLIQQQGRSVLIMMMRWRLSEIAETHLTPKLEYLARKADWAEAHLQEKDTH